MLVVDAANVVGSRPDGWWRDRPGAARRLVEAVRMSVGRGDLDGPVAIVLEGAARRGAPATTDVDEWPTVRGAHVDVVHADASGDDTIVALVETCRATAPTSGGGGADVRVVTADRDLRRRVEYLGAATVGPRWLRDVIGA